MDGRKASGYKVESFDGLCALQLPDLIEYNDSFYNREEIPSPEEVRWFPHLMELHISYHSSIKV